MVDFLAWLRRVKPGDVFLWIVVAFAGAMAVIVSVFAAAWAWGHS